MDYIIQTNHLSKKIKKRELVSDINIHIKKGEIYGFLGPNGAGKTTVMKMITNLWKPTKGNIEIFGETLTPRSYNVLKNMGSIIEYPTFYEHLNGYENLKLHCEYMGYYKKGSIEEVLKLLGLSDRENKPVKSFSLGMKQRLAIARAILSKPEILILDEPTNGLDPSGMKQIRDIFKMLSIEYGITLMISTHILSEIETIANTIGIINKGKLLNEISMDEILEMNTSYIELGVNNTKKTVYILSEKLDLNNFKIIKEGLIRIYDISISTQEISKILGENEIDIELIRKVSESLEDYFLRVTSEVSDNAKIN